MASAADRKLCEGYSKLLLLRIGLYGVISVKVRQNRQILYLGHCISQ